MKVLVTWPKFGPYHLARLTALSKAAVGEVKITGLETNLADSTYQWTAAEDSRELTWEHRRLGRGQRLFSTLDAISPDVICINGWGFRDSLTAHFWAWKRKIPAVLFSDSRRGDSPAHLIKDQVKRLIVQNSESALVAGPQHKAYLVELGMPEQRVFTGLDVVDNNYFAEKSAEPDRNLCIFNHPGPRFLYVGRFVEKKNVSGLLAAYQKYYDACQRYSINPWRLELVGDGPLASELQNQTLQSGLESMVCLYPFQQYDSIPIVYRESNCLVVPSTHSEQWGLVVNEAMACSLPVIASTACGCVESLIQHGKNGFLVSPNDELGLCDAMLRVTKLNNESIQQFGRTGRQIVEDWGLDRFSKNLLHAVHAASAASS